MIQHCAVEAELAELAEQQHEYVSEMDHLGRLLQDSTVS